MILEKLHKDLFNKIPENSKIVIFGAGDVGQKIYQDIIQEKPNVNIIGFIDNYKTGTFKNLPIWSLKSFVEKVDKNITVIMSTRTEENIVNNILALYDILIIPHSIFLHNYYRNTEEILNENNYENAVSCFENEKDQELYQNIFKVRKHLVDIKILKDYYNENYGNYSNAEISIRHQYLDKIQKSHIRTVIDVGMNSGLNVIAFNKLLPNIQKTYGFEAIYDKARVPYIEDFILNNKLKIVEYALGEFEGTTEFLVNTKSSYSSFCGEFSTKNINRTDNKWNAIKVNVTTLDNYCSKHQIKPDFIKMDIEGAELPALKGGMDIIKKFRPQLAISIYHSNEDFINIPLFLKENLENYIFKLGHYHPSLCETVLYAIPNELM